MVDGSGNWSVTPSVSLPEGSNSLGISFTDPAGNTSPVTIVKVNIDSIAPDTSLFSTNPVGLSGSTILTSSVNYSFGTTESGSTFECSLDGGAYTGCTSPMTYSSLSDGTHTIRVRAVDQAGNADMTPIVITFTKQSIGGGGG